MNKNSILLWSLIILGIAGIVLIMLAVVNRVPEGQLAVAVSDADWTKGPKDAPVTLVEYSDFQCPACAFYFDMTKQLEKDFSDKLLIVFRHFPLETIHPNARAAAEAAEAAGQQGKFWEMHDFLFSSQDQWANSENAKDLFITFSGLLGLDKDKFITDAGAQEVKDKINKDIESGNASKIIGTPTFFLNGKQISNPENYDGFKQLVAEQLNQ